MEYIPLTAEQKRQFEEEGYLIVRGALDAETIASLIEAGDRLIASDRTEDRQRNGPLYDGFRNSIALDDAFIPLLTHPKTFPLIAQLMGPNLHLVTSHLIYKHPDPAGTPTTTRAPGWHRDVAGTVTDLGQNNVPRLEMKCAYYLTDLSQPNYGATLFSPGSNHLKQALPIRPGQADPDNVLEPLLQPGDAVFFENRTFHAATANLSSWTRKAIMFGYGYRWMRPMDYLVQPATLLEKVSDPIGRQLLGVIDNPDGRFKGADLRTPLSDWFTEHDLHYKPLP
jgi:ectoine hydroxylase-related dioxygenase (phytanoyl-CoA dioxygenase family)